MLKFKSVCLYWSLCGFVADAEYSSRQEFSKFEAMFPDFFIPLPLLTFVQTKACNIAVETE